jgi:hypothetical protein
MVKLIASDLDGTLLLDGTKEVSPQAIDYIKKLQQYDVVFAAASGRQYPNLRRLFQEVEGDIAYICENGALVKYRGETLFKQPLDRESGLALMEDILNKDQCEVLLSGEETSYLLPKSEYYVDHMKNYVGNNVTIVKSFEEVKEDFLKISVYEKRGIDYSSDYFQDKWGAKTNATVSGACWMDFVARGVDKGVAIQMIQRMLKTTKDDTMCFGDSYNDLAMFENSLYSYAMTSANSEIRARARYVTTTVESILYDVYQVLSR